METRMERVKNGLRRLRPGMGKSLLAVGMATAMAGALVSPVLADDWGRHDHGRHEGWHKHHHDDEAPVIIQAPARPVYVAPVPAPVVVAPPPAVLVAPPPPPDPSINIVLPIKIR